jgi:flagellar L-ring protein precursor FlgH
MKKIIAAAILIVACSDVFGASVWAKRDLNARGIYTDDVARQTGDVLTVIISEDSKVDNKSTRDLKKTTNRSSKFNGEMGIVMPEYSILPRVPGFNMSEESSQQTNGQADFKDQRSIVDRITVVIQDVLPNGNLVVIGSRSREVGGDTQTIQVSGIVRPSDITFDNTIKSEQVADFQIVTSTKGVSEPYKNPGWFGRILDILWPF